MNKENSSRDVSFDANDFNIDDFKLEDDVAGRAGAKSGMPRSIEKQDPDFDLDEFDEN